MNSPDVVRWNVHNGYLLEVARAGTRIPRTRLAASGDRQTLRQHLENAGWHDAVIKPAVSASGYSTRLVTGSPTADDEQAYAEMIAAGDVVLQARVPEVQERGEWSLPRLSSFGSTATRWSNARPPASSGYTSSLAARWNPRMRRRRSSATRNSWWTVWTGSSPTRVDGADVDGRLMLMELELIEPELFLDHHPEAAARLATARCFGSCVILDSRFSILDS